MHVDTLILRKAVNLCADQTQIDLNNGQRGTIIVNFPSRIRRLSVDTVCAFTRPDRVNKKI